MSYIEVEAINLSPKHAYGAPSKRTNSKQQSPVTEEASATGAVIVTSLLITLESIQKKKRMTICCYWRAEQCIDCISLQCSCSTYYIPYPTPPLCILLPPYHIMCLPSALNAFEYWEPPVPPMMMLTHRNTQLAHSTAPGYLLKRGTAFRKLDRSITAALPVSSTGLQIVPSCREIVSQSVTHHSITVIQSA